MNTCAVCLRSGLRTRFVSTDLLTPIVVHAFQNFDVCSACEWSLRKFERFVAQCRVAGELLERSTDRTDKTSLPSLWPPKLVKTEVLVVQSNDCDASESVFTHSNHLGRVKIEPLEALVVKTELGEEPEDGMDEEGLDSFPEDDRPLRRRKLKTKKPKRSSNEKIRPKDLEGGLSGLSEYKLFTAEAMLAERERRRCEKEYSEADFKCESCVVAFKYELTLKRHLEQHEEDSGSEICSLCTRKFTTPQALEYHVASRHSFISSCKLCGANKSTLLAMSNHLDLHRGIVYPCRTCGVTISSKRAFNNHMKLHDSESQLKCTYCDKTFPTPFKLKKHELGHKAPSYPCQLCGKKFRTTTSLMLHNASVHSTSRKYYCVECDKYYKNELNYKYHFKKASKHIDSSMAQFRCERCDKSFVTSKQLTCHVDRVHLKVDRFTCEVCASSYVTRQGLKNHHRRRHLGLKQATTEKHECNVCQKLFSTKNVLRIHFRVHTGEKPFECADCRSRFAQKSTLKTHIRLVHLKIKNKMSVK